MSKSGNKGVKSGILGSLGWPLLLGTAAWIGFYLMLHRGVIQSDMMRRYFAGHEIEYIETGMFFLGLAALLVKGGQNFLQFGAFEAVKLPPAPPNGQSVQECGSLLDRLAALPATVRRSYLALRLEQAIRYVSQRGTASDLPDHLKYLSDIDAEQRQEDYSLVRIVIWATPMLGFLGTVVGITMALGDLSKQSIGNSPDKAIQGLLSGLGVAFDTTALALSLSIFLMFTWFVISLFDQRLLQAVDSRVESELLGRFQEEHTRNDPDIVLIRGIAETVLEATERLVERQAELWQGTIQESRDRWNTLAENAGMRLQESLEKALCRSIENHADRLAAAEARTAEKVRDSWKVIHESLREAGGRFDAQQAEMHRQGELMLQVVRATGDVVQLEQTLNDNLNALAGSKRFEDTVMSLSAAIHLLNTRLNESVEGGRRKVSLNTPIDTKERAA